MNTSVRRNVLAMVPLLAVLCTPHRASAQPYDGVFTALWQGQGTYHNYYAAEYAIGNVEYWKKEVKDMERAGFDFVAPYSFGRQPSAPADAANFGALAQAIIQLGSPLRIAYFHDTNGDSIRYQLDNGLPTRVPYDLALGEARWRADIYEGNIKRFFDTVPVAAQFRPFGQPVLFFYVLNPVLYSHRELAGDLLDRIRQWFFLDYGVQPIIILEGDWTASQPQATLNKVLQNANAFYSWGFLGTPGQKGVVTGDYFPGGGNVVVHPTTGISVGTAGVGYHYVDPNTGYQRIRSRQNGQSLIGDWNAIAGAHIRMVAAWLDLEEDSGVCRTAEFGYQYVDLVNSLINPAPVLNQVVPPVVQSSVPTTISFRGNGFRPGAVLLFSPDGVSIFQAPVTYIAPQEVQLPFAGGVPVGTYYVAVQNPNGVISNVTTITVHP